MHRVPYEAVAPLDLLHQEVPEILQRFDLCFKQMIYTYMYMHMYVCIRIPLSRIRMRIQGVVVVVVDFDLWISQLRVLIY